MGLNCQVYPPLYQKSPIDACDLQKYPGVCCVFSTWITPNTHNVLLCIIAVPIEENKTEVADNKFKNLKAHSN